jgi:glycosyltransferase involved in cell wall biosynthesis
MEEAPLNILQIILNLEIGGAQEVVRTLSKTLAEQGHQVVVCSFRDGPLREDLEAAGIQVEILPERRYSFLALPLFGWEMLTLRAEILTLVQTYEIDIIQTHLLQSLDFLIATLHFTPEHPALFWTVHNYHFLLQETDLPRFRWLLGPKRGAYRLLYRLCLPWIEGIIAVSADVREQVLRVMDPPSEKVAVIPNCVEIERYQQKVNRTNLRRKLDLTPEDHCLLVVATLKEQKGHRFLLEAVAELFPDHPELQVFFAGDGALRDSLIEQTETLHVADQVHFLGNRDDVPELLAACDLFVLPSLWEGLAMALIEAMASGVPIIATDVSGSRQVIKDQETGLLVPPGDSQALAEAIQLLLTEPARADKLARQARAQAQAGFSAGRQAEEHLRVFQSRISSRNRNRPTFGASYG